jgi:hypothetical protein
MAQKQKTSNLLEILTWEKFKLHLNEHSCRITIDKMELLEFTQGDEVSLLVHHA